MLTTTATGMERRLGQPDHGGHDDKQAGGEGEDLVAAHHMGLAGRITSYNVCYTKLLRLHSQRIAKEIAKQQIDLAQTGHEPTLDLSAGLSSAYTNYEWERGTYQDGTLNTASVGLSFNLPLYQGGAVESRVKQAQFNYVAASESLEKTFRDVQATLNRNYNDVNGSIGTVRAYQQSVISAESALTATRAGYEVGTRTVVDLLDATRNLYSAKQQLVITSYSIHYTKLYE